MANDIEDPLGPFYWQGLALRLGYGQVITHSLGRGMKLLIRALTSTVALRNSSWSWDMDE